MKKMYFFILFLITLFCLSSCKGFSYDSLNSVTYENLLSLSPSSYIVVAYQANCSNCEKLKDTVEKYYQYAKKNNDAMPIYGINVNLEINNKIQLTSMSDPYPSQMMGTRIYSEVKVKSTPSIMVISGGKLIKVISDYSTQYPVTEGKKYLTGLMN